ncbi:MAG: dienelactone hydrolase family protein, partial [Nitrosopumilaceae archaeon]
MKRINIISISIVIAAAAILGFAISYNPEEKNSEMLIVSSKDETLTVNVNYFDGAIGFLARPSEEGNYPGVIMIHEWWGLNDNIKDMARELATEGYVVLAVDLHNGEVATTPEKARELVSSLDDEKAVANMK